MMSIVSCHQYPIMFKCPYGKPQESYLLKSMRFSTGMEKQHNQLYEEMKKVSEECPLMRIFTPYELEANVS